MDLLGAYGSDSDDSSIEEQTSLPVSSVKKDSIVHNNDSNNKETKKGKRLLQLNAILPQTIFERLSRPEEDSDSENENDSSVFQRSKRIPQKKSPFTSSSSSNQENNFFGSLLDDLKSVAPTLSSSSSSTTTTSLFKTSNDEKEEKIGMALQTTSSVKRSKKTNSARIDVVNVHDKITTLSSDESHNEQTIEEEEPTSPTRMRIQTSRRRIEKPKLRISAAPPIISKLGHDAIHPPATREIDDETNNNTVALNDESQSENNRQPTMSKREMEKALRAGNINLIHQSAHSNLVEMEGAPTAGIGNTTTKEEWEQMKMTHGKVNLRGLVSYDPKAGSDTTVNDLTSKHRSKHQIHQLMASAARLEAQRNSSLPSNTNSSGRNTHRTNAKRKYGW